MTSAASIAAPYTPDEITASPYEDSVTAIYDARPLSTYREKVANSAIFPRIKENRLGQAFTKAAKNSGLKVAFKLAAAGTAGALGANVYGVALAGSAGVTVAEAVRDYAAWRKEQERKDKGLWSLIKGFFGFVKDNKKTYAGKFVKNAGIGLVGAGIGAHFSEIKEFLGRVPGVSRAAEKSAELAQGLFNGVLGINSAYAAEAELPDTSTTSAPEAQQTQSAVQNGPNNIVADMQIDTLSNIDTFGWDAQAQADLKAARAGKGWALQNLAHYAANGQHGLKIDVAQARALALEAQSKGSPLSARFLADLDKIAPQSAPVQAIAAQAPAAEPVAPAAAQPFSAPFDTLSSMDTSGWDAQAQADLKAAQAGKGWALQNLAHYAANGQHGLKIDIAQARALALEAQSKGSPLSAHFLADLNKIAPKAGVEAPSRLCVVDKQPDLIVPGLASVDFTLACENPATTLKPDEAVLVKFDKGGYAEFVNSSNVKRTVGDMMENINATLLAYPEMNGVPYSELAAARSNSADMQLGMN